MAVHRTVRSWGLTSLATSNRKLAFRRISRKESNGFKAICVYTLILTRHYVAHLCTTSLEPLPFPANHFDFVRGCRLSFHVPEDEVRGVTYIHALIADKRQGSFVLEVVLIRVRRRIIILT